MDLFLHLKSSFIIQLIYITMFYSDRKDIIVL